MPSWVVLNRTGLRRRAKETLLHIGQVFISHGGHIEGLPPSVGSASTAFPSLEKKITAPVAALTETVIAAVEICLLLSHFDLKVVWPGTFV